MKVSDFFGDADTALRERERAEEELRRLKDEYERESMMQWNSFVNGQGQSWKQGPRRLRRPSARNAGSSPLKNVKSADDLALEADDDHEDADDRSSTMSRSPSLISDSGSYSSESSEELGELYQPPANLLPPSNWTLLDATYEKPVSSTARKTVAYGTPTIAENEEDDQMLPDYAF